MRDEAMDLGCKLGLWSYEGCKEPQTRADRSILNTDEMSQ